MLCASESLSLRSPALVEIGCLRPAPVELLRRYQAIVRDPKYRHFTRIPERIVRCMDRFHTEFDREAVRERLLAHYIFVGVVDDAIDSGQSRVAETVFDSMCGPASDLSENLSISDVVVVSEMLKRHLDRDLRVAMLNLLQQALHEIHGERAAVSITAYTEHRKALGRATAKQSYLLVQPALSPHRDRLCRLMQDIGAVGCLVDSVIDIRQDSRLGLLNFNLTISGYAKLCLITVIEGIRVWVRMPSLTFLLAEAILDNIRDRSRACTSASQVTIVIEQKDEVAGIA